MKRKFLPIMLALAGAMLIPTGEILFVRADEIVSEENAIVFYSGESSVSYYIDAQHNLYVSGSNGNGEFGNGKQGGTYYTPVKTMENIATVADGKSGFAVAVGTDGKVYGWGKNEYAQLGQGTAYNDDATSNRVLSPVVMALPDSCKAQSVAAGESFTVVLTEAGEVYTCGRAGDGQTGIANLNLTRKSVVGTLTKIDRSYFGGESIIAVDAAENTGFALSESGVLYLWGANDKGILGNGSLDEGEIYETPTKLTLNEKIAEVSAETMTVMVRTENGDVYVWGDNSAGQLGTGAPETAVAVPSKIEKYYDPVGAETQITVKSVLCGGRTNFVLSSEGQVFSFGAAGSGQAGCNLQSENYLNHPCISESSVIYPMLVQFYQPISLENATDEIKEEYGDKTPVDLAKPITVAVEKLVGSIGDRTFVMDKNGNMWSWGNNLYGMVCSGDAQQANSPVRTTLYRKENYDQTFKEKNYLIKPAVVMSLVVVLAATYFIWVEIKIRRTRKKIASEEELRKAKKKEDA